MAVEMPTVGDIELWKSWISQSQAAVKINHTEPACQYFHATAKLLVLFDGLMLCCSATTAEEIASVINDSARALESRGQEAQTST